LKILVFSLISLQDLPISDWGNASNCLDRTNYSDNPQQGTFMTPHCFPSAVTSLMCAGTLLLSASMHAAAKDEKSSGLWSGDLELGYVSTSGNTKEATAKTRVDVNREKEYWRYNIALESLNSESSGTRSAERYFFGNRLAYQYTETNFTFGYISYDDDRFSGFDYQATASAGWGRRLINDEVMQWDVEIGPGYRFNKVEDETTAEDSEELIVRGFTKFIWDFSDTSTFSQSLNVESGEDNTISKSITGLKVQVNGSISIKLSYTVKYTDTVPQDTERADTESAVTVNYSF
jgi:putative salt-induced outer membrane protein